MIWYGYLDDEFTVNYLFYLLSPSTSTLSSNPISFFPFPFSLTIGIDGGCGASGDAITTPFHYQPNLPSEKHPLIKSAMLRSECNNSSYIA